MTPIDYLVFLGIAFWLLVRSKHAEQRVRQLEDQLRDLEQRMEPARARAKARAREEEAPPTPVITEIRPVSEPKPPAMPPSSTPSPPRSGPPARPSAPARTAPAASKPVVDPSPPAPSPPGKPAFEWKPLLEKVKLWPPSGENAEAAIGAWWLSRLGLIVLIIGAVFFGVRIAENTPPGVRLATLAAIAAGVATLGVWLERRLPAFGRLISAGGLALGYLTAFGAYAIEATKVIDNPAVGFLVQALAVVGVVAWSWWKRDEAIAAMAVLLGLVACWFSHHHDLDHFVVAGLLCLAAAGGALLVIRRWLWPHAVGMAGAWGGFLVLGLSDWPHGGGPGFVVELGSLALLAGLLEAASFLDQQGRLARPDPGRERWRRRLALANTSLAIAVGWLAMRMTYPPLVEDGQLAGFYLGFALLVGAFTALRWWKGHPLAITETFLLKAMGLLALFVVARFDGPTRWLSLSAQVLALLWTWRRSRMRGVEVAVGVLFLATLGVIARDLSIPALGEWCLFSIRHLVGVLSIVLLTATLALHARWLDGSAPAVPTEPPPAGPDGRLFLRLAGGALCGAVLVLLATTGAGPGSESGVPLLLSLAALVVAAPCRIGRSFAPVLAGLVGLFAGFAAYVATPGTSAASDSSVGAWLVLLAGGLVLAAGRHWQRNWHGGHVVRLLLNGAGLVVLSTLLTRALAGGGLAWQWAGVLLQAAAVGMALVLQARRFPPGHLSAGRSTWLASQWVLGVLAGGIMVAGAVERIPQGEHLPIPLALAAALVFACAYRVRNAVPAVAGGLPLLAAVALDLAAFADPGLSGFLVASTAVIAAACLGTALALSRCKLEPRLAMAFDAVLQLLALLVLHWLLRATLSAPLVMLADVAIALLVMAGAKRLPFPSLPFVSVLPLVLGLGNLGEAWLRGAPAEERWIWWAVSAMVGGWLWFGPHRLTGLPGVPAPVGRRWLAGLAGLAAVVFTVSGFQMLAAPWHLVAVAGLAVAMAGLGRLGQLPGCQAFSLVPLAAALTAALGRVIGLPPGPPQATLFAVVLVAVLTAGHGVVLVAGSGRPRRSRVWCHALAALGLVFLAFSNPRLGVESLTTVFWGLSAIVLFGIGLVAGLKPYRLTGLIGLGLAMLRMFLVDIDEPLYRIYAFFAIAAVLLGIGYLYHRFRDLIERADGMPVAKPGS